MNTYERLVLRLLLAIYMRLVKVDPHFHNTLIEDTQEYLLQTPKM